MTHDITTWTPDTEQRALLASPNQDLTGYIRSIRALPLLTAEEELALARRYHEHQDLRAAEHLVLCNLRYVVPIARSFRGYGLPEADLIQEGSIGLMKAVKRFDITAGVRLMTFATHWIRAEINEYVLRNWRTVKIATTKAQRKLFFKLRGQKDSLDALTHTQAARIAQELGVKTEEVLAMDMRLSAPEISVAVPNDDDDNDSPVLTLVDYRYMPEQMTIDAEEEDNRVINVRNAMATLNAREQHIVQSRLLADDKATLSDLSETFGISIERVRQIEVAALKKLKAQLSYLVA
jgi:RNA polymerase sigma-32 factor